MHDIKRSVFEMPVKIHSENVSWGGTYNLVLGKERGLEISIYDIKAGKLSTERNSTQSLFLREHDSGSMVVVGNLFFHWILKTGSISQKRPDISPGF